MKGNTVEKTWEHVVVVEDSLDESSLEFISKHSRLCGIFLFQVVNRIKYSKRHLDVIRDELSRDFVDFDVFWPAIYGLTTTVAQISLIFDPTPPRKIKDQSKDKYKERETHVMLRGKSLRNLINLEDDHVILNRKLRNRFMHIDEDIDEWYLNFPEGNFFGNVIGNVTISGDVEQQKKFRSGFFEHFDNTTDTIIYRGEEYSLNDMIDGLDDLVAKIGVNKARLEKYGIRVSI